MKCSNCKKEIDLTKREEAFYVLEEKEIVYGEFAAYPMTTERKILCSIECLRAIAAKEG